VRVTLDFELSEALSNELQHAARASRMSPAAWAAQTIEAELAVRVLETVSAGRYGPRMTVAEETDLL
jgi:predicted transcriptional regulator